MILHIFNDTGELGNRLVTLAHAIAFSLQARIPLNIWSFWRYEPHFVYGPNSWRYPWKVPSPEKEKGMIPVIRKWQSMNGERPSERPWGIMRRLGSALVIRLLSPNKWKDHCYWSSRADIYSFDNVSKHETKIRLLLSPKSSNQNRENFLDYPLNIGVHYRRGDYRDYRKGLYSLSEIDYFNAMQMVVSHFYEQKLHFHVFSNEKIPIFPHMPNASISYSRCPSFFIDDFNGLGKCSHIIGPPSTFSGMSAFLYDRPIWHFVAGDNVSFKKWLPTYY